MSPQKPAKKPYSLPIMLIIAVLIGSGMVRLGFWQLDRADQKQSMLDQLQQRAESAPKSLDDLLAGLDQGSSAEEWAKYARFQPVLLTGRYVHEQSILIDNQVVNNQGGYQLITPFQVSYGQAKGYNPAKGSNSTTAFEPLIMVSRGWLPAGQTRQDLPIFTTPDGPVQILGRLNSPYAQPPLWKDGYPVNDGMVWQYLPIDQYAQQIQAQIVPLMVELAPENKGSANLVVRWQAVNDQWVAKHKGYAFQWFSMALAFLIACLILVFRAIKVKQA